LAENQPTSIHNDTNPASFYLEFCPFAHGKCQKAPENWYFLALHIPKRKKFENTFGREINK